MQPKLHILKLISGHELFPFTDQLKEFSTTFREIDVHKSTDLSHYRYLNLLSRNKSIKSVFWPINVAAQITTGCNSSFVAPNNYFVGGNCIGRRLVYKTHRLMKSIVLNQYIR